MRSLRHELTLRRVLCNSDVSVVLPLPVLTRNSVVWRQTAYGSRALVAFVRDAIAASSFSGAVITWETVSRSGTARTSSQLPRLRVSREPVGLDDW